MGKDVVVTIVLFAASIGYFTLINWWMMDIQGLDYWYMFRTGAEISAGTVREVVFGKQYLFSRDSY